MYSFSPHTRAESAKINQNFTDLSTGDADVDGNSLNLVKAEMFLSCIHSGLIWSQVSGLNGAMTTGVAHILDSTGKMKRTIASAIVSKAFTASKDTYVDLKSDGTIVYIEVANNATTGMTLTTDAVRLAKVVTSGVAITSIVQYGSDPLKNELAPKSPKRIRFNQCHLASGSNVGGGSTTTSITNGVVTVYPFDQAVEEVYDPNSLHSITTNNSRITVKESGIYKITASVYWPDNTTGVRILELIRSGTAIGSARSASDANGRSAQNATTVVPVTAGQYIEVSLYQNSGGNLTPTMVNLSVELVQ